MRAGGRSAVTRAARQPDGRREQGFALLAVLWACALLALVAADLLSTARTAAIVAHTRADMAAARAAADAGVPIALAGILGQSPDGPFPEDGRIRTVAFGDATLRISVQDELGLIDVNTASIDMLRRLFAELGATADAADAAARAVLRLRERSPIPETDDLSGPQGLPRPLLARAARYLTTRNGTPAIDPVTAPPAVLHSLPDLPRWRADRLIEDRVAANLLPATMPLLNDDALQGPPPRHRATIRSESIMPGGARFVREAEVELLAAATPPYRVRSWRQSMGPP